MKITIFCSPERKDLLVDVSSLFDEYFIETHAFFFDDTWNRGTIKALNEGLLYSDYFILFPVKSDFSSQWFSYVLGAAATNNKQVLINTFENSSSFLYSDILEMYMWSDTIEELRDHLEEILPQWDQETKRRIAMRALQDRLDDHTFEGLARAVEKGDRFMVGIYLEAGFNINKESMDHVTLIGLAARHGYLGILQILYKAGGDLNKISTDRDNSPLMDAASEGHHEIVRFLINHEADLERKSKSGQTALALAVGNKNLDCAVELINAGADPDIVDSLGLSARKYAELYAMKEILDILPAKKGD